MIKYEYPPNYKDILEVLPAARKKGVVFTYGEDVYSPSGKFTLDVAVHEDVHIQQQNHGAKDWWDKYLSDPAFRFQQELQAYQQQWVFAKSSMDRFTRRKLLRRISKDLAGPIYGNMVDRNFAAELIKTGTNIAMAK